MNAGAARGDKKFRPYPSLSPGPSSVALRRVEERVAGGRVRGTRQRKGNGASNTSQQSQPRRIRWIKPNQTPFKPDQAESRSIKVNQAWGKSGHGWRGRVRNGQSHGQMF